MTKVYILLMSYDHPQVPIDKYYYSALYIRNPLSYDPHSHYMNPVLLQNLPYKDIPCLFRKYSQICLNCLLYCLK